MEFFSVNVGGVTLVGGLEWRTLTGLDSASKEIGENASDIGAARYVGVQNATDTTCGFLPDDRRGEIPNKAVSVAALLAGMPSVAPDCVLFLQREEKALLVALRDGLPAPGYDCFGPVSEMLEAAHRFIQMCNGAVSTYGNGTELECRDLTLDQMVAESSHLKIGRLRAVPKPWVKPMLALVGTIVACVAVLQAYTYYQGQKRLAAERLAYVDVDAAYAKSTADAFKTLIGAKQALADIRHLLANVQTANGGWLLAEIICQKDGCTYMWKNDDGTNRSFVPPASALNLTYSAKGDVISYQEAFVQPLRVGVDASALPTSSQVLRDVLGNLQAFKNFSVEPVFEPAAVDFALPPGLPRAPSRTYKEGTYSIGGPGYAMDAVSALPNSASFDNLHINIDAELQLTFTIAGKYYVQ
jgi:hypothetical protein